MKEELTREVVEAMARCTETQDCVDKCAAYKFCNGKYWTVICSKLATALLEEMDKPKHDVWENAPPWAIGASVIWDDGEGQRFTRLYNSERYTRELPKTRARQIAENIVRGINDEIHSDPKDIEYVEGVLNKYAEELTKKEAQ